MTCCRQWWPIVVRISSLKELVHIKSELRDHGTVYQVMECKSLLDKIGRIWSNVAYNGPVFVIVLRCDRLGSYLPCITFLEQFWHIPSGFIILRSKCHVARKRPEMVHNHTKCPDIARGNQLWSHLTQHFQFWSIFDKGAWKGYVWLMTTSSGIYYIIWHLLAPYDLL